MSYKCQKCNTIFRSGRPILHIAKKRVKYYPYRAKANPGFQTKNGTVIQPLKKSRRRSDRIDDPGGKGWEIASELIICPNCAKDLAEETALSK